MGYYLAGEGREQLEVQLCADTRDLSGRGTVSTKSLVVMARQSQSVNDGRNGRNPARHCATGNGLDTDPLAVPLIVAVSQLISDLLSEATTRFRTPRPLPRMDFSAGIPADCATMVVIPCMLTSHASISQLLTSLEVCWLGNQNEHLRFALLTDFADSTVENPPENALLLRQAITETEALNRRYPGNRPRFYLLHRQPEWIRHRKHGWAMNVSGENWHC